MSLDLTIKLDYSKRWEIVEGTDVASVKKRIRVVLLLHACY